MFHCDISFTSKEKAIQFGEDAKNFLISYKDALDFLREKAYHDEAKDQYLENAKTIMSNIKSNYITFSKYLGTKPETTFTPTFHNDDQKFKLAKYTYFQFKEHFGEISKVDSFDSINKKLDHFYETLSKQASI